MMATTVATGLEIEGEDHPSSVAAISGPDPWSPPDGTDSPYPKAQELRRVDIRPVTWEEWIRLPIREQDEAVRTVRGAIRVPTVIVVVNYAKVPKKRPKLCARSIRERDGNRCQYTGVLLEPEEGSSARRAGWCPARAADRTRGKTWSGRARL